MKETDEERTHAFIVSLFSLDQEALPNTCTCSIQGLHAQHRNISSSKVCVIAQRAPYLSEMERAIGPKLAVTVVLLAYDAIAILANIGIGWVLVTILKMKQLKNMGMASKRAPLHAPTQILTHPLINIQNNIPHVLTHTTQPTHTMAHHKHHHTYTKTTHIRTG